MNALRKHLLVILVGLFMVVQTPYALGETPDLGKLKSSAEQGHAEAQFNLGLMYYYGEGVPQNHKEAVRWYRSAAEQGHASAQYNLGVMCSNGDGVPQNYKEALGWYLKAAKQGNPKAQGGLGRMYALGQSVPRSYVMAHTWVNLAAAGGQKEAGDTRDRLAKLMTPEQIAEAQRLAREWIEKHWKDRR